LFSRQDYATETTLLEGVGQDPQHSAKRRAVLGRRLANDQALEELGHRGTMALEVLYDALWQIVGHGRRVTA
jgi:hypothetical protein